MKVDLAGVFNGKLPEADWLIPNLISRGSMILLIGDAGCGKSYLSYYLAVCLAGGLPFLNRKLDAARVIYFDEENSLPDMVKYLSMVWVGLGRPDISLIERNLRVEHMSLQGNSGGPFAYMDMCIHEHAPDLAIIDTAMTATPAADENDNSEAIRIVSSLRGIQARAVGEMSMWILRHSLTGTKEGRGAKSWKGLADGQLYMSAKTGPKPKSHLRRTAIEPRKVRAYGLRNLIEVTPAWVENGAGIVLSGVDQDK